LAVGSLQLMLDRGQSNDWVQQHRDLDRGWRVRLSVYLFVVHVLTTRKAPFIAPALFKDRNFLTGNLFIFLIGVVLFATLALLPPLLQSLLATRSC
jgi:DHA2 family multidrug resistance protein